MSQKKIGFLLLDRFSMLSFTSALEPLEVANQVAEECLYEYFTATVDGEKVRASTGVTTVPDFSIAELIASKAIDTLIVVGGSEVPELTNMLVARLQRCTASGVSLGGVASGVVALAKAGFYDGQSCSVQREFSTVLQEERPRVAVTLKPFTTGGARFSCAGGCAMLELMINRIADDQGQELAQSVAEALMFESSMMEQSVHLPDPVKLSQPKLAEIIALMEANLEEPLSLTELAGYVGISRRHLERIFKKHLDCTPLKYYIKLRLLAARQLLKQTSRPIIDVAAACGFVSAAHFSKCYKAHMHITPKAERQGKAVPIEAAVVTPVSDIPAALLYNSFHSAQMRF
ncbi:GlxA family transcriptional regulator [Aliamphritea spongicola]|uniref:GlxA family transcriptional regulator n=1 Tax=Aliamphritea spongicola TaxID=707589 RepID=UPI00196A7E3C|nr:GlxA family transcriptional regulator [Aliamphritea spongicola]MBN3562091.1 GlxA family transcriptional regulator [Aliamphritea spongicola]